MKTEKEKPNNNFIWRKILIIIFWLSLWQILALLIDNAILLEGPWGVAKRLAADLVSVQYYRTVGASVLRIMGGMLSGVLLAVLLAVFSWKKRFAEELFMPVIQFVKAAPITCFVVLLLIWAGPDNLAYFVALLVAFPPVYFNCLEGLKKIDAKLLEVARVYHMPFRNRVSYIYLPQIKSYFFSALTLSVGMAFKAGIAAEIIGTPDYSMGEKIYMSKIYLDTEGVLSWMITVIFVSFLCEKIVMKLWGMIFERHPICVAKKNKESVSDIKESDIILTKCRLSYHKEVILDGVDMDFEVGQITAVTGISGIGKTTLLKCIGGLLKPESGDVKGNEGVRACAFQENRLFENFTALENVFATGHCNFEKEAVKQALSELLPKDSLLKPVGEYSGGMQRRVEIARAFFTDSRVILLDEPFAGLDEETKQVAVDFIGKYRNGRTVIFTTHAQTDIEKLGAKEYRL